ncbi:MAG: hypothetical protein FWG66_13355 [Spirochaetes bacterium]|nr:hypothetical protein [Spirochaetota bacterium]
MKSSHDIVFTLSTEVSEEEQQKILAEIESMSVKSFALEAEGGTEGLAGEPALFKAKKKGSMLPLAVNAAALFLLAIGIFAIVSFHSGREEYLADRVRGVGSTEMLLIDEIRRETASVLAAQDAEISLVLQRVQEIEAELYRLNAEGVEISPELLAEQQDFHLGLAALQDERALILESSRIAEARLRLAPEVYVNGLTLSAAALQLEGLANEMQAEMAIEAHLSGGFSVVNALIEQARFNEAGGTLNNLRLFLSSPAFDSVRSQSLRQELYNLTFNSLDLLITELSDGEDGLASRLADLEAALETAQSQNASLQAALTAMASDVAGLNNALDARDNMIMEQSVMILNLRNALFGWGF